MPKPRQAQRQMALTCLTPSSRSRIKLPEGAGAVDEFDRFLKAG